TLGAPATATLTIADNDFPAANGKLQFSATGYSVNEGAGTATITVTRTGGGDGAVSVDYASGGGAPTPGQGYTAVSGRPTWAAGDSGSKTFTIPILEDGLVEGNETVALTLTKATGGATLGTPASATLTIVDNDVAQGTGQFRLSASGYSVNENAGTVTITVLRTGGSAGAAAAQYTTYDLPAAAAPASALGG